MLKLTNIIAITVTLICSNSVLQAAETQPVVEAYSCNYLAGKNQKDLDMAVDFWQKGIDKIGSKAMQSYFASIMTPLYATTDADFHWLGSNVDLNTWAAGNSDYTSSKFGASADAKFKKMSKCKTNLYFSSPLYTGFTPAPESTGALMMTAACKLKDGATMADVKVTEAMRIAELTANAATFSVYKLIPYIANTPNDLVYLIVHSDLNAFASAGTMQLASKTWMASSKKFNSAMQCESALYTTRLVHSPLAAM